MDSRQLEALADSIFAVAAKVAEQALAEAEAGATADPAKVLPALAAAATRTQEAAQRLDRGQGLRAVPAQYALASLPAEALAAALQVLDRPELAALRPVLLPVLEAGGPLPPPAAKAPPDAGK